MASPDSRPFCTELHGRSWTDTFEMSVQQKLMGLWNKLFPKVLETGAAMIKAKDVLLMKHKLSH